jgi:hypothetical protein
LIPGSIEWCFNGYDACIAHPLALLPLYSFVLTHILFNWFLVFMVIVYQLMKRSWRKGIPISIGFLDSHVIDGILTCIRALNEIFLKCSCHAGFNPFRNPFPFVKTLCKERSVLPDLCGPTVSCLQPATNDFTHKAILSRSSRKSSPFSRGCSRHLPPFAIYCVVSSVCARLSTSTSTKAMEKVFPKDCHSYNGRPISWSIYFIVERNNDTTAS